MGTSQKKEDNNNYVTSDILDTTIVRVPHDCSWEPLLTNQRQKNICHFVRSLGFYWGSLVSDRSRLNDILIEPGDCVLSDIHGSFELFHFHLYEANKGIVTRQVIYRRHQMVITNDSKEILQFVVENKLRPVNRPYLEKAIIIKPPTPQRIAHNFSIAHDLILVGQLRPMTMIMPGTRKVPIQEISIGDLKKEDLDNMIAMLYDRRHFGCERIWRYIGIKYTESTISIFMEDIKLGSVAEYIRSNTENIDLKELSIICYQTCDALRYLEKHDFVHKRLSLDCLLLASLGHVKLAIYGQTSSKLYATRTEPEDVDRARWMPAECLLYGQDGKKPKTYDNSSMVHTFGTILWSLHHQAVLPYENETAAEILNFRYRSENSLEIVEEMVTPKMLEILKQCWEVDATRRPRFKTLKVELKAFVKEVSA